MDRIGSNLDRHTEWHLVGPDIWMYSKHHKHSIVKRKREGNFLKSIAELLPIDHSFNPRRAKRDTGNLRTCRLGNWRYSLVFLSTNTNCHSNKSDDNDGNKFARSVQINSRDDSWPTNKSCCCSYLMWWFRAPEAERWTTVRHSVLNDHIIAQCIELSLDR